MLKGISPLLSPELLKVLCEMGHGDEIVFADANFPAVSTAKRLVRADGHGIPELLAATLELFPLNRYLTHPVMLMQVTPGDPVETPSGTCTGAWWIGSNKASNLRKSNVSIFMNAPKRLMRWWPPGKRRFTAI